ncbi:hypothetical protein NEMIN01_1794 [Nematocida minor]|uniref:uncharacterized protein n=1 Tax=Nematocida minor TaxID=1912983 RepID=UPI00221E9C21|nr:uncharacterized protein NEMIN01_1794 [Nematocida minor]KAI5192046.1 hypothetical protein NEMIN01_1794 [Nematocida minor]
MRKVLFIALLVSFAACMTTTERLASYMEEMKRKTCGLYNSMGGIQGVKNTMAKNIAPLGSKIKEHTKNFASKINTFGYTKVIPQAKKAYASIKEKINTEKEKRKDAPLAEKVEEEHAREEDIIPLKENEEEQLKEIEKFLRDIINGMKEKGEHVNLHDDYNYDANEEENEEANGQAADEDKEELKTLEDESTENNESAAEKGAEFKEDL